MKDAYIAPDVSQALRELGQVTIFAFSDDDSDASFMVVGRDGQRVAMPNLSLALFELLTLQDHHFAQQPIARNGGVWDDEDF